MSNIVIVGGSGKVAIELTKRLLDANLTKNTPRITSIVRSKTSPSFKSLEALPNYDSAHFTPVDLSLEDAAVGDFASIFEKAKADIVVFSAGAGGKAGEEGLSKEEQQKKAAERTRKVDYEGAVKVYDAIEQVQTKGLNPRLILVSAVDIRDENIIPSHYNEEDKKASSRVRSVISHYIKMKYLADKDLIDRTKFKWTILRPGGLTDVPATGKVDAGITHIGTTVSRADVAHALAILINKPEAAGLALDVVGGNTPIEEAFEKAIAERAHSWVG